MEFQAEHQYKKLMWASRRGMLELDVVLIPFLEQQYSSMDSQQLADYSLFLEEADPDLYSWIMGYAEPKAEFAEQVAILQQFVNSRLS